MWIQRVWVVYGCSAGGDLALEVATMTDVTALAAEEPATVYFTGITDRDFPKSGPRFTPNDSFPISADPKRYYTTKYQTIARDKIGRIRSPIHIVQGDQRPINRFNREVLIPELQSARKALEVSTYPGEPHCFCVRVSTAIGAGGFESVSGHGRVLPSAPQHATEADRSNVDHSRAAQRPIADHSRERWFRLEWSRRRDHTGTTLEAGSFLALAYAVD